MLTPHVRKPSGCRTFVPTANSHKRALHFHRATPFSHLTERDHRLLSDSDIASHNSRTINRNYVVLNRESQPPLTSAVKVRGRAAVEALLTSAGAPHVGQAPQAVRVAVTIAAKHALIGSRDHGPRAVGRAVWCATHGGVSPPLAPPCPAPPPPSAA